MLGGSNKLISAKDTADRIGVHHDTFYRNWEEWGLKGIRIGTRIKFRERDIEEWLSKREGVN